LPADDLPLGSAFLAPTIKSSKPAMSQNTPLITLAIKTTTPLPALQLTKMKSLLLVQVTIAQYFKNIGASRSI
jgi:hypothetical protein